MHKSLAPIFLALGLASCVSQTSSLKKSAGDSGSPSIYAQVINHADISSVYQPIVAGSNEPLWAEALCRFKYQDQFFRPDLVFNYAYQENILPSLDKKCLEAALSKAPYKKIAKLFVNMTPQSIIAPGMIEWLSEKLRAQNVSPTTIVIEVIEATGMVDEQSFSEKIAELKSLGFAFAIDDFGTGVSNHQMLRLLRPSVLKIAGDFVKNISDDQFNSLVVNNILALASDLGATVIAERVEVRSEYLTLKRIGVDRFQGFYFARPMTATDFAAFRTTKIK